MILLLVVPLILLSMTLVNFVLLRTPKRASEITERIGVVVPLRNESENVEALIATLSAQIGPFHFYLLDDNSEDLTLELLKSLTQEDPRFTLVIGKPLAHGWIGKTWALQQLYEHSHEEIIISLDADVRLSKGALNFAVTGLNDFNLDFISPYPQQIAVSWGERLVQPLLQWSWLTTVPLRLAESFGRPSMAVANGQFFLVRRAALMKIDGYQRVKDAVIDDLHLARQLISSGATGTVVNGSKIAQTRMYSQWSEIKSGYGKSLHKAFGSILGSIFVVFFLVASSIAPLVFTLMGNEYGLIALLAIIATRMLSAIKSNGKILDSLLHPISVLALIYLIVHSYLVRHSVLWKGRRV